MDPSQSGIDSFKPSQLHELLQRSVIEEKSCNFAALKQMSLYVLQFWGAVRFHDIQGLKLGHLVQRLDRFDLLLPNVKDGSQSSRVIPIYPTPAKFVKTFCPVFILSNYLKARHGLGMVDDDAFLFPKVESTFEHGTNADDLTESSNSDLITRIDATISKYYHHWADN